MRATISTCLPGKHSLAIASVLGPSAILLVPMTEKPSAKQARPAEPVLGFVIPCYNEEEVLPLLFDELHRFSTDGPCAMRFLFVDDGSSDRTFELIAAACFAHESFSCIRFSRNFGHQMAVTAGLAHAEGDVVAIIDADLQDPLAVIPEMLDRWREGYDVVYGVRQERQEGVFLRFAYALFYRMLKRVADIDIPLDAGDFSLIDRRVVEIINKLPEQTGFVRGLRGWVGFRQVGVPYSRAARRAGTPKYNLKRLTHLAINGIVSFSSLPLRLAAWLGALSALLGLTLLVWTVLSAIAGGETPPGWASLAVIVLFFGGVQLVVLGIIGEYLGRVFEEVKGRPRYIVAETIGSIRKP